MNEMEKYLHMECSNTTGRYMYMYTHPCIMILLPIFYSMAVYVLELICNATYSVCILKQLLHINYSRTLYSLFSIECTTIIVTCMCIT